MARFSFSVKMEYSCLLLLYLISFQDGVILINSIVSSPKYNATVLVPILYGVFFVMFGVFFSHLQPGLWYIFMSGHWYDDLHQLFYVAVSHHNIENHVFFLFSFSTSLLPLFATGKIS